MLKIQEESRNTFNKKAFVYKEGDLVVIQKTQFSTKSKLYPKYIDPYKGPNRTSCSADKPWIIQDPSELSKVGEVQDI
ncbi:hypothetical protein LAZ67_18002057 [Cordylochernes scorpioides]|uniref:Uncharacterized protein n=1 Tax=Cordylochernes scorpioides TaxID=51811 RepID=A0ABY6LGA0_9ARAC|nr:hypothetical protein LAZ67_18002057 [Cordylochernes scorpioides]